MNSDILISDVAGVADRRLISSRRPNLWKAIPYTTDAFVGTMIGCGPGPKPVPIEVNLNARGRYRIWVGLFSFCHSGALRFRLSGDTGATLVGEPAVIANDLYGQATSLHATFWKEADLTGQTLVVEPSFSLGESSGCALAFLRLEPVGSAAVAPAPRVVRHPMAFTNDGHGIFGERPHFRPEDLLESIARVPDHSCTRIFLWGTGDGDMCNYPTRVGNYFPTRGAFLSFSYRTLFENMALWRRKGWDSLAVMRDYVRRRGWEFQPYLRMESFDAPYPFDATSLHSRYFHRHPEFHCFDNRGQRVMRLSYAYPAVQDHMLKLIGELAGYGVDGVCLALIRGVPLVLYEKIMVAGFQRRHGMDPRTLAETDPCWLAYQAEVLTPFIQRAKAALRRGQRLSVLVPGNEADCRHWGFDVAAWVENGYVDDVLPVGQRFNAMDVHEDDPARLDFDYFQGLAGRHAIRLIPTLYPWSLFGSDYPAWQRRIYSYLDRGADMYAVWDATPQGDGYNFAKVDIGYADRREPSPPGPPPPGPRYTLLTLDGFRNDRYQYFEVV